MTSPDNAAVEPNPRDRYSEILEAVSRCVVATLALTPDAVSADSVLLELGAQSFDFVELVLRLEREFGINIPKEYAVPDAFTVDAYARAVHSIVIPDALDGVLP
jgi:acyl carrier protein